MNNNIMVNDKLIKIFGTAFFIYTLCNFIFSYIYTEWIVAQHLTIINQSPFTENRINYVNARGSIETSYTKNKSKKSILLYKRPSISIPSSIILNNNTSKPCAILFFGVPKLFKKVAYPSIKKYIIDTNPTCDIFVHTYNITSLGRNERNKEPTSKININEIYSMTKNVIMDSEVEFLKVRNLTFYRQYFPHSKESWIYPQSLDNMMKQWHSIESVWNFMEEVQHKYHNSNNRDDPYYKRIGLFRIDLEYMNPINIFSGSDAVLPDFGLSFPEHELNDRLFYGSYDNAYIWSHRFDQVDNYFLNDIGKEIGGLHSETMIYLLMTPLIDTNVLWKAPICARRIRLTGHIEGDCWCKKTTDSSRELPCIWWGKLLKSMNQNKK